MFTQQNLHNNWKAIGFLTLTLAGCKAPVTPQITASNNPRTTAKPQPSAAPEPSSEANGVTHITVRNVHFIEPKLNLDVPWLQGRLLRTKPDVMPNMDDSRTFRVDIESGVVEIRLADLGRLLNTEALTDSPMSDVTIKSKSRQLQINGRLRKGASFPFEALTTLTLTGDNRIRIHIEKMRLLKVPVKGLLRMFRVDAQDLIGSKGLNGVEVKGNDVLVNQEEFLPPPRKLGKLSGVHVEDDKMIYTYGNRTKPEVSKSDTWRNFLHLEGGMLSFGKLVMHDADITMIDIRNDAWFVLDLKRYQQQMALGYTRMTPSSGLRIFMPDIDRLPSEAIMPPTPASGIEKPKRIAERADRQ